MPFDLDWVGRRTHYVAVALNPFVYFYARPAHALMLSFALGLAGAAITPCNVQSIADRSHNDAIASQSAASCSTLPCQAD